MSKKSSVYKKRFPLKAILPWAQRGLFYIIAALASLYLAFPDGTGADKALSGIICLGAVLYMILGGRKLLRTYYRLFDEGLDICIAGKATSVYWSEIETAAYDANASKIELILHDGEKILLENFDDIKQIVGELDTRGIMLHYKRLEPDKKI